MKNFTIKTIALGAMCASLLGAASIASAGDWHGRGFRGPVVGHYSPGFRVGLGLGVVIGAPAYPAPVYYGPGYYGPSYYGPAIAPEVVIGIGGGGGRYYHGGGGYSHYARRH